MGIEIKELSFRYKNSDEAIVKDFNLEISKGEIISILGESGSGKSTILRIIAGLEVPEKGLIKIKNKIIVDERVFIQPENRGIGMVFQDYALFPHMTVEGNVKFGLKNMSNKEKDERFEEVLSLVGLRDYKKRYPYELSGGQQQRVALARALAPEPSLLLLDEPFSNLDKDLQDRIRDELKIILKQTSTTTIFVTHDRTDAVALADRVVVLEKGQIKKIGMPSIT
ncbi:ABC transporter ATP-binding protein [Alkaliphilus hydrothermalis]|uniref:Iron(III) transport system ATP-binding protein n=1 Tax=Alkaliphilus hydrothermalis TaxID=1482730 RepID=A0ABS2NNL5_9FIRM|nr:ABC transporter ATP-binding protein [Alkaliphilus hydrothermalis]MBM7614451.1 iron(III) transport system ATP-binding protein [Alkaliphilus hydrothermalis]